jgi:hypothetical protein
VRDDARHAWRDDVALRHAVRQRTRLFDEQYVELTRQPTHEMMRALEHRIPTQMRKDNQRVWRTHSDPSCAPQRVEEKALARRMPFNGGRRIGESNYHACRMARQFRPPYRPDQPRRRGAVVTQV